MQERGLKLAVLLWVLISAYVAPYAGAWIEIFILSELICSISVAPYAGAWIEILSKSNKDLGTWGRSLCRSVD